MKAVASLLTLCVVQVALSWDPYDGIRTGTVELWNNATSGGTTLNASSTVYSYNITYTSAITQTRSAGTGIVGVQTQISNQFSVNVSIINFLVDTMRLTAIPYDDTVVTYLLVNYIAVGDDTYFMETHFYCFLPSTLSAGNGTRTETQTHTSRFVNFALTCNTYLSGFRMHNSQGLVNYLLSQVSCPSGSSTLTHTFTTAENNTVQQVCYTTVVFCQKCTVDAYYYEYGMLGTGWVSETTLPSTVFTASQITRYRKQDRMFWGINGFNFSRGYIRSFHFQSDFYDHSNNLDTSYASYANHGTYAVSLDYFWIARRGCNQSANEWWNANTINCVADGSCADPVFETLGGSARFCQTCNYTCKTCSGSLANNCTDCESTYFRSLNTDSCPCNSDYIDIGQAKCFACQEYMTGCSTCLTTNFCTACQSGFTLNANALCQCSSGYLVTGVCTNEVGCTSASLLGGTVFCQACDATLFFQISNYSCVCMTGYSLNSTGSCVTVCGDSVLATGEGCDDGNTAAGDGCDASCAVESGYYCNTAVAPSVCYILATPTATVDYVRRTLSANRAVFAIKLSPYYSAYDLINFENVATTDLPCTSISYGYSNQVVNIYCDYSTTIEGNSYTLTLDLSSKFYSSARLLQSGVSITVTLPANGMNAKLTYDNSSTKTSQPFRVVIVILDILTLIVLGVSMASERMIGIELIQTLQSCVFTMAMIGTAPSTLSPLQTLQYSNGYWQLYDHDYSRTYTLPNAITQIGLQAEFVLNYNLVYLANVLTIVVATIMKAILGRMERNYLEKNQNQDQSEHLVKMEDLHPNYFPLKQAYKFTVERVWLVLLGLSMFMIVFAMGVQLSGDAPAYYVLPKEFNLLLCAIAVIILVTGLIMIAISALYPGTRIFPLFALPQYVLAYFVYQTLFMMLATFMYGQSWALYLLLTMSVLHIVYVLCTQPYPSTLHNFTLVLHQATIILALCTYIYEVNNQQTQNYETFFTIMLTFITVLLYLAVLLAVIRIYSFRKHMKNNLLSYDQPQEKAFYSDQDSLLSAKGREFEGQSLNQSYVNPHRTVKMYNDQTYNDQDYVRNMKRATTSHPLNKTHHYHEQSYHPSQLHDRPAPLDDSALQSSGSGEEDSGSVSYDESEEQSRQKYKSRTPTYRVDQSRREVQTRKPNTPYYRANRSPRKAEDMPRASRTVKNRNERIPAEIKQKSRQQDEVDRLKAIKARLRRNFQNKMFDGNQQMQPEQSSEARAEI